MTVQTEFMGKTFDQIFESFRTATESTVQMQKDMLRKWTALWPGFPKTPTNGADKVQQFQKEWPQVMAELTRKYIETWEQHYKAGVEALEEAFHLPEAKDPEELRQKLTDLWHKSFESLRQLAEAQIRNFQGVVDKCTETVKKTSA
jgi:DNA anti-recombination protein RmuC